MREGARSPEERLLIDHEFLARTERRERAVAELQRHVRDFMTLDSEPAREEAIYHRVLATVYQICADIVECEAADLGREEIVQILEPVRRVHARSPFVARLQQWPRGYAGDFETVEYLISGTNRAGDPLARVCESYALTRSIAQQHRNRVRHQAGRILRVLLAQPGASRIASLACGSCPDLRSILDQLPMLAGEIWLNDIDAAAIDLSRTALMPIEDRCRFIEDDAVSAARRMPRGAFDLVLAGGLFDYLPDRVAVLLIQMVWRLLAPGGTFFFTNIASSNPYRPLIEYFGDWKLIERSEDDIYRICDAAGISRRNATIAREETGLALLIDLQKLD